MVDTGIDYNHPDLVGKVVDQTNFAYGTEDAMDDNGHGTHVAGIITSEGMVYRGVAHDSALMAVKVLDSTGNGYASDVVLGINWCVEHGADVISMSIGEGQYETNCDDEMMAEASNDAVDAGVVVVAAAGNDGVSGLVSPACGSKVISVGAVDKVDLIASYSNRGPLMSVVAPGGDMLGGTTAPEIISTFSPNVAYDPDLCMYQIEYLCYDNYFVVDGMSYIRAVGTSMATPHVSGAVALLLEAEPGLTPAQVKETLEQNADDLGSPGEDDTYGWGRINVERALQNTPPPPVNMSVVIDSPADNSTFDLLQIFDMGGSVTCPANADCGDVYAHAQYCFGEDCNDFEGMTSLTPLKTDVNPVFLGQLTGDTTLNTTLAEKVYDTETIYDLSEDSYVKVDSPSTAIIGGHLPTSYSTGNLQEVPGVGAIEGNAHATYNFTLPSGTIKSVTVHMTNYIVIHWSLPFSEWHVYTSDSSSNHYHQINGECIPNEGGGGEPPPEDCWFFENSSEVLNDFNLGGVNYIDLESFGVGFGDWLTFNTIEVIVDYEPDPNNDQAHRYYVKFNISQFENPEEIESARLKFNVNTPTGGCVGQIHHVDNIYDDLTDASVIHEADDASYSSLANPITSFNCQVAGVVNANVKAALEEAINNNESTIAFQLRQQNEDKEFIIDTNSVSSNITLSILHKPGALGGEGMLINAPMALGDFPESYYDTMTTYDLSDDSYIKEDALSTVVIGGNMPVPYSTGNLQDPPGVGAIEEDAHALYSFTLPDGTLKSVTVHMTHYIVIHFSYPFSGWHVYTSDESATHHNQIDDECIPNEGGGGEPPPEDCWMYDNSPGVLADFNPGGINYVDLESFGVGFGDWLTFNTIELIFEYEVDPNDDNASRYYVKFDISGFEDSEMVKSAKLKFDITDASEYCLGQIYHVRNTYDGGTDAATIHESEYAQYSSMNNPIGTFNCQNTGVVSANVLSAVKEAIDNNQNFIAFQLREQDENQRFTIDGSSGGYKPNLAITNVSSGAPAVSYVNWNVTGQQTGPFNVRIYVNSSYGFDESSEKRAISVGQVNAPTIEQVICELDGFDWKYCKDVVYGDNLTAVYARCTDEDGFINRVFLRLINEFDGVVLIEGNLTEKNESWWYYNKTSELLQDSGKWLLQIQCIDNEGYLGLENIHWDFDFGKLSAYLIDPSESVEVLKDGTFEFKSGVKCEIAECGDLSASLKEDYSQEILYHDNKKNSEIDLGTSDPGTGIAEGFIPDSYPVTLKKARFYISGTSAYEFEFHVWDTSLVGEQWPRNDMITPFDVKPISSSVNEIGWFEVDLSSYNITINDNFYIGGIRKSGINKIGYDTNNYYGKSVIYSIGLLGDYEWATFTDYGIDNGELMITVIVSTSPSGELQELIPSSGTPFYTEDENPLNCSGLKKDDICEQTWHVNATGNLNSNHKLLVDYESSDNNTYVRGKETEIIDVSIVNEQQYNTPKFNKIQCERNGVWDSCSNLEYNNIISKVRVNCTDPSGQINSAHITLKNVVDNKNLIDSGALLIGNLWVVDNNDFKFDDSGDWKLTVICIDNESNAKNKEIIGNFLWGRIEPYLVYPDTDQFNVSKDEFFTFTAGVRCKYGECGNVTAILDPTLGATTCSDYWGFSCHDDHLFGKDNTFNSCFTGYNYDSDPYNSVWEVHIEKGQAYFGDLFSATCEFYPYNSLDSVYIYYYNGTGWRKLYSGKPPGSDIYNQTVNFYIDAVKGIHYIRCIESYWDISDECADTEWDWYDNDDIGFNVSNRTAETGKTVVPMNSGIPFYTIDQNPFVCENMKGGDVCELSWRVNATGPLDMSYNFSVIYETTNYHSYVPSTETNRINVTIVGFIPMQFYTYNISLKQGWNLISIPLYPINISFNNTPIITAAFGYYDGKWKPLLDISDVNLSRGYWIHMLNEVDMILNGTKMNDITFDIKEGWNLIGYPSIEQKQVNILFNDVIANIESIKIYNNSKWLHRTPGSYFALNDLNTIYPGQGIWVKSLVNDTWTFDGVYK